MTTIQPGYANYLARVGATLGVPELTDYALAYPGFTTWSGSIKGRHHYGEGGLLRHTYEVAHLCMENAATAKAMGYTVDERTLFLAAVFHDVGKVYDYAVTAPGCTGRDAVWSATLHHRRIHHINRSAVIWTRAVAETGQCRDIEDDVLHCILAHHGSPERGSPVLPQTREAWMLHLCDAMSAWLDGVGKMDPKP